MLQPCIHDSRTEVCTAALAVALFAWRGAAAAFGAWRYHRVYGGARVRRAGAFLAACCGFDLCHKYIFVFCILYFFVSGSASINVCSDVTESVERHKVLVAGPPR